MNQIARQGKDMLEIVEKYEVPREYHDALWAAYEAGAEMGFWKATDAQLGAKVSGERKTAKPLASPEEKGIR